MRYPPVLRFAFRSAFGVERKTEDLLFTEVGAENESEFRAEIESEIRAEGAARLEYFLSGEIYQVEGCGEISDSGVGSLEGSQCADE